MAPMDGDDDNDSVGGGAYCVADGVLVAGDKSCCSPSKRGSIGCYFVVFDSNKVCAPR